MNLEQLKSELKEKEKGCGKTYEWKKGFFIKCGDYKEKRYQCSTCKAEISALKKGIEACEEIQSTHKKILIKIASKFGVRETLLAFGDFKDVEIDEEILSHSQQTKPTSKLKLGNRKFFGERFTSNRNGDKTADTRKGSEEAER